jgi:CRISPR-associated protein Csd1
MILSALNDYYHRLVASPDSETGLAKVPPYGFSEQQISYCLVLSKTGELVDIEDVRDTSGKKARPKIMSVPSPFARPGQYTQKAYDSGKENAFFLWDKTAYALGLTLDKEAIGFSEITHASFRRFHLTALAASEDAGLKAFSLFIQNWIPQNHEQSKIKLSHIDANLVFKLDGDFDFMHQRPAAQVLWLQLMQPEEGALVNAGDCLVTGKRSPLARLHPAIKGVYGGQTAGGSIVSFNAEAYTSYGKEQGDNAPISEAATFAYTTALNYLLRRDNGQCVSIGDASTVFWATAADADSAKKAEVLFGLMVNMPVPAADDAQATAQIKPLLEQIAQGKPLVEIAPDLDTDTRFYVLGLAPNASRLSIRYWLDTTFGELAHNVAQHFKDLALDPLPWKEPPSVWRLLIQTVPHRKNSEGVLQKSKSEDIAPQLAGELLRSIITGENYPHSLLAKIIQRLRADGDISRLRVSLIKAVLCRQQRLTNLNSQKEGISMALNKDDPNIAYRLGRLFAVLEQAQKSALGNLNAGIGDKYYGAASSTPRTVFSALVKNARNHISSLRKGKKAEWVKDAKSTAGWLEKELGQIMLPFDSTQPFPKTLNLDEQGRFVIGYYHQRHTKQSTAPKDVLILEELNTETETENEGE